MSKLLVFFCFILLLLNACKVKKSGPSAPVQPQAGRTYTSSGGKQFTAETYIERFKNIAIADMNANGIPASIKLAQGLLESGNGNSELAVQANNHFGIKCNIDWKGRTIYKDDDEKNECFRVYQTPEESYRDHTEFLKRKRYAALFELNKNDYKGWAQGLKDAGYATNPKYPELLISLIERYQLNRFDSPEVSSDRIKREQKVLGEIAVEVPREKPSASVKAPVSMKIYEVKAGDTLYAIAKMYGLSVADLKALNNIQNDTVNLGQLLLVSR
ncbi:MAG: glucosaminidase domain-containing protein [Sphingobacteriaceae bacterium]